MIFLSGQQQKKQQPHCVRGKSHTSSFFSSHFSLGSSHSQQHQQRGFLGFGGQGGGQGGQGGQGGGQGGQGGGHGAQVGGNKGPQHGFQLLFIHIFYFPLFSKNFLKKPAL